MTGPGLVAEGITGGSESPSPPPPKDDRATILRGMAWVGSLRWAGQATSWAATILVTRLLVPADYGILGMAMVFINVAQMLSEFGIGSTVVAMQDLDREAIEELNSVSILLGVTGFVIALMVSPLLVAFYRQGEVGEVVAVLGLLLVVNGLAAVPLALITKGLDYRGLAAAELLRSVVGGLASLAAALAGAGVWALVLGQLLGAGVFMTFVMRRRPTAVRRPNVARLRGALAYSRETMMSRVAWMAYSGMPALIGGRLLAAAPLGAYTFAWSLATLPGDRFVTVVTSVWQPVLARNQADKGAIQRMLASIIEAIAFVTWPFLAGLAITAPLVIEVVFGPKWAPAALPLTIAATYNMVVVVTAPFSSVFLVTGEARRNRMLALLGALVLPLAFLGGAYYGGAPGLTAAWWVAAPLFTIPSLIWLGRLVDFGFGSFVRAVRLPALATVGTVIAVVLVLNAGIASSVLRLATASLLGAAVMLTIAYATRGARMRELYTTLRRG